MYPNDFLNRSKAVICWNFIEKFQTVICVRRIKLHILMNSSLAIFNTEQLCHVPGLSQTVFIQFNRCS